MTAETVRTEEELEATARIVGALTELHRTVQKIGMYPATHPMVPTALEKLGKAIDDAREGKRSLTFGVARQRLLYDGEPLDEKNLSIEWLARLLHEAGIAVLELNASVTPDAVGSLVQWLYRYRRPGEVGPSGRELVEAGLPGIRANLVDYEQFAYGSEASDRVGSVWETIARSLMTGLSSGNAFLNSEDLRRAGVGRKRVGPEELEETDQDEPSGDEEENFDPQRCADRMRDAIAADPKQGAQRVASELLKTSRQVQELSEDVRGPVLAKVSGMIGLMNEDFHRQLLRVSIEQGGPGAGFVADMGDAIPRDLFLEVLSEVADSGRNVPYQFMTLLKRLVELGRLRGANNEEGASGEASPGGKKVGPSEQVIGSLREVFTKADESDYREHNPATYQGMLEGFSEDEVQEGMRIELDETYRDPREDQEQRLGAYDIAVQLVFASGDGDDGGEMVEYMAGSLLEHIQAGRMDKVRDALDAARHLLGSEKFGEGPRQAAVELIGQLRRKETIDLVLDVCDRIDQPVPEALSNVFAATGPEGVVRALSVIPTFPPGPARERRVHLVASAEPSSLTRGFDQIAELSTEALRAVVPLLRRLEAEEAIEIAKKLKSHEDSAIRIEGYRTLASADRREGAFDKHLEEALWDSDSKVGRFSLDLLKGRAGKASCEIISRFIAGEFGLDNEELRLQAVRVLGELPSAGARDALIRVLNSGRMSFRSRELRLRVAAERELRKRGDTVTRAALSRWQRSLAYWVSLLVVRRDLATK